MDKNKIIAMLGESEDGNVEAVLANRPEQERLSLLKEVENFMQYIGCAGEMRVMSELFIRGVNVMNGRVDNGFDLTAMWGDEVFLVQVKTAFLGKDEIFSFNLSTEDASAKYVGTHKVIYIFVLVSGHGEKMNFLILPKSEFEAQKKAGNIWFVESTKRDKVKIYLRDGKASLGKVDNNVSEFLDNWDCFLGEESFLEKKVVA